jgi:hypothetical protein
VLPNLEAAFKKERRRLNEITSRLTFRQGGLAAALCCAALLSCSDVEPLELSDATLEGAVTYKGEPVPYALVIVAGERTSATGKAGSDGTYTVPSAPLGLVTIAVNTDAGRGMMMSAARAGQHGDSSKPAAKFIDVPKKYHNPSTSGITTTVLEGTNKFDIKIK